MSDKRCGNCGWWRVHDIQVNRLTRWGKCEVPLPTCVKVTLECSPESREYEGTECPCWKATDVH